MVLVRELACGFIGPLPLKLPISPPCCKKLLVLDQVGLCHREIQVEAWGCETLTWKASGKNPLFFSAYCGFF